MTDLLRNGVPDLSHSLLIQNKEILQFGHEIEG